MNEDVERAVGAVYRTAALACGVGMAITVALVPVSITVFHDSLFDSASRISPILAGGFIFLGVLMVPLSIVLRRVASQVRVPRQAAIRTSLPALREALESGTPGAERLLSEYAVAHMGFGMACIPMILGFMVVVFGGSVLIAGALAVESLVLCFMQFPRRRRFAEAWADGAARLTGAST